MTFMSLKRRGPRLDAGPLLVLALSCKVKRSSRFCSRRHEHATQKPTNPHCCKQPFHALKYDVFVKIFQVEKLQKNEACTHFGLQITEGTRKEMHAPSGTR